MGLVNQWNSGTVLCTTNWEIREVSGFSGLVQGQFLGLELDGSFFASRLSKKHACIGYFQPCHVVISPCREYYGASPLLLPMFLDITDELSERPRDQIADEGEMFVATLHYFVMHQQHNADFAIFLCDFWKQTWRGKCGLGR